MSISQTIDRSILGYVEAASRSHVRVLLLYALVIAFHALPSPGFTAAAAEGPPTPASVQGTFPDDDAPHVVTLIALPSKQHTSEPATRLGKRGGGMRYYVLPLAKRFLTVGELAAPHHDYAALDIGVPVGTPVMASSSGRVEKTTGAGACGTGVVIQGSDGYAYTYCHGSALNVTTGDLVAVGTTIMSSGNSGHSTGPHLHLQIRSPGGALLCPQPLLQSWFAGGQLGPESAPTTGCYFATKNDERKHDKKKPRRSHHQARNEAPSATPDGGGTQPPQGEGSSKPDPKPNDPKPSPDSNPTPDPKPTPTPTPSPTPSPLPVPTPTILP